MENNTEEEIMITTIMLLFGLHFLCDFALQNDYMAQAKNRNTPLGKRDNVWVIVLTAHAAIHALAVLCVGLFYFMDAHSAIVITATLFTFISHWVIDLLKCNNYLGYWADQLMHLLAMLIVAYLYVNY